MSNQGFIPVSVDLDTLNTNPEIIQVRNAGNFTPDELSYWQGMGKITTLNTFLSSDSDINSARNNFLQLDPNIQRALISLNPEAEYAQDSGNSVFNFIKKNSPIVSFASNPLRSLESAGRTFYSALENTVLNFQNALKKTIEAGRAPASGAAAIEKVTSAAYWGEGWNGYNKWNQERMEELDGIYNRATGVFIRGTIDNKNPLEIIQEYGTIDEDLVKVFALAGTPELDVIFERYSRHKINLGSKIVDWAGRFAPLKENPTPGDSIKEALAVSILNLGGARNVARNEFGEFVTERLFSPGKYADPGPGLDMAALFFFDPLTYMTFGGSRGLSAFSQSTKTAQALQSSVNGLEKIKQVEELFKNPRFVAKSESFLQDVNTYRTALAESDTLAAGNARIKISLDHDAYDDDVLLGLLIKSTVKKEGKEVPITDLGTFFDWFKTGDNLNYLTNGTVNNLFTFREEAVALQTRQFRMVNGLRSFSTRIFQGLDRDVIIGAKPIADDIVDTWEGIEKAILARPALNGIESAEDMVIQIAKNDDVLETLAKTKIYALKDVARIFGEKIARTPEARAQIFWNDELVDKTLNNFRNYTRLITGDRLRSEALTQLFKGMSKNDRINMLFNLDKLYLNSIGAAFTPAGIALRDSILQSRYMYSELASIADYTLDVPNIFKTKGLEDIGQLPAGPSAFMHTTNGITLMPFDSIASQVFDSMGKTKGDIIGLTSSRASAEFKYGSTNIKNPKDYFNLVKKIGYMYHTGATNTALSKIVHRGYVFALLIPKLGIKNAVDEATVLANVSTPALIADLLYGKGRQLSNINLAVTGSNAFQGPVKELLLNMIGKNPAKYFSAAARKDITSSKKIEIEFADPTSGEIRTQFEYISAEEFYGMPPEEFLVRNAVERYGSKLSKEEKEFVVDHFVSTGDNVSDAMIGSVVGATYGDSLALGTALAKEIYGKSPLTEAIEKLNLKVLSKPYVDIYNSMSQHDRMFAHFDYFYKLLGKNSKGVDLPEFFFMNNALKTEQDVQSFLSSALSKFGWKADDAKSDIKRAISLNDSFGQVSGLRAAGISEKEISKMIIKNAAIEMRFVFHGGKEYNQTLWNLISKKHYDTVNKVYDRQDFDDLRMLQRERAGVPEPISDTELARRAASRRAKTKWSATIEKLTWGEFEEATKGFTVPGKIKTSLSFDDIKKQDIESPGLATRGMQKGYSFMDRTNNDMIRSDVFFLKILEERKKLKPNNELLYNHLIKEGSTPDIAALQSKAMMANQARYNSANSIMKYIDNPTIKSNFAYDMRVTGRFIRATEDFAKRTTRWMLRHPLNIPYRIGHVSHASDGSGIFYDDKDGNKYVIIPNDGVFWQDVAPAIVMLGNLFYAGAAASKAIGTSVLNGTSIKDSPYWGFFKQAEWNQYKLTVSLANPSYSENAGLYTFMGPAIALPVIGLRNFLVKGGTSLQNPDLYNFGLSVDNILLGGISDDVTPLRATLPPALINYFNSWVGEGKDNQGAVAAYQAISYMQYINPKKPEDFLNSDGVVDSSKAEKFLQEWRIQVANTLAQKAAFNSMYAAPIQLGEPGISEYLRRNGTVTLTKEYGDILRAVIDWNAVNGYPISDPYTVAVSMHASERPGKLIFQVNKGLKESKIAINYTKETLSWSIANRKFINKYSNAGWIFAPNVGEYNPQVISYMQAADLIPPDKNAFDDNNAALKSYIERITVAKEMSKYYDYDRQVERLLNDPNNPNRNFFGYRAEVIATAAAQKQALVEGSPLLKEVFQTRRVTLEGELTSRFNELRSIISNNEIPKEVSLETKSLLTAMVRSAAELIRVAGDGTVRGQYLGDTLLEEQVAEMNTQYKEYARQNPILKEAYFSIIKPLLDKTFDPPIKAGRKAGD